MSENTDEIIITFDDDERSECSYSSDEQSDEYDQSEDERSEEEYECSDDYYEDIFDDKEFVQYLQEEQGLSEDDFYDSEFVLDEKRVDKYYEMFLDWYHQQKDK